MRVECDEKCDVITVLSWFASLTNGIVIPFTALAIALAFQDECSLQPRITTYMYVIAALCLVNFTFSVTSACCLQRLKCWCYNLCNKRPFITALLITEILLNLTIFCWLITGSVWIYGIYSPMSRGSLSCNRKFYRLAFSHMTITWISFILHHVILCMQSYFPPRESQQTSPNLNTQSHIVTYTSIKSEENNNAA